MPEKSVNQLASNPPGRAGVLLFSTLVLCAAFGEVATGLIVPAMPSLGNIFNKTPGTVQLAIGAFAFMFAVGQLFFGPFSDRSGRRTALLIGAALTLVGSATAGAADSFWVIIVGRAIQGFGAASGYVVSRAIVRDIYGPEGSAKAMAILFALMAGSFLAAPLVGGALLGLASWRAGFVLATAAALVWLASTIFIMPETGTAAPASETQAIHLVYLGLFRHRGFLAFMLTHSMAYAGLYCFVAGAPYFFIESLNISPSSYGVIAAIVLSGFLVGSTAARYAIPRWGMEGVIPASLAIMLGGSAILVGLGVLGWLSTPLIVVLGFTYWFGGGFLAPNTAAGVMMSHPKAAGAAAAVLGFVQMCAAAAVALLQGLIYDGTVFPMVGMQLVLSLISWIIWSRLKRYTV
ncbi:MAG: multidrug effflux MFS transporter [Pseudomonadota bacterium]|nr:multidrug effflux MFS transporter [Pseudomonadota bacterium]